MLNYLYTYHNYNVIYATQDKSENNIRQIIQSYLVYTLDIYLGKQAR